jgi:hypothetical protein
MFLPEKLPHAPTVVRDHRVLVSACGSSGFPDLLCYRTCASICISTALWWAVWGPCCVALLTVAGIALITDAFISKGNDPHLLHYPRLASTFGWVYLITGVFVTAAIATVVSWFHQFLMHRVTFALFRLYATAVVAGIGSVFGWCVCWWMLARSVPCIGISSIFSMLLLVIVFGVAAYKGARSLRGQAPKNLTWITRDEYVEGTGL